MLKNTKGFSLVEVMIAAAVLTVIILAATTFFVQQLKSNNFLEFQARREQLRLTMLGQFFSDSNNCKCLFRNSQPFPIPGINRLVVSPPPTAVGKFDPADCSGGVPYPLIASATASTPPSANDGLKLNAVSLDSIIRQSDGTYIGDFNLSLDSTKEVLGPKTLPLSFRVAVNVVASGANVNFDGCSLTSSSGLAGTPTIVNCRIPRGGSASCPSPPGMKFCAFTGIDNGSFDPGDDKCDSCGWFKCQISGPDASGVFTMTGSRNNDPRAMCNMACL